MKVLGINGSPRAGGNTDILLNKMLAGAESSGASVEKIILNNLKFVPCQECTEVRNDGTCLINDDLQNVYKQIDKSDAIILASPIFFGSVSAQTKMMIDRYQCLWRAKYLLKNEPEIKAPSIPLVLKDKGTRLLQRRVPYPLRDRGRRGIKKKVGVFISVEASRRQDFFVNASSIVKNFFYTINVDYTEEILVGGVAEKGSILKYPEILQRAFDLGTRIPVI